jgi:hypothetical protein
LGETAGKPSKTRLKRALEPLEMLENMPKCVPYPTQIAPCGVIGHNRQLDVR